jgi:D-cysteine desulfhydrase
MRRPKRINLAILPTPVQKVNFRGKYFFIKRDDMTEMALSGNKVRKLEFLIPQAIDAKADYIFTCGGEQSNFARATAVAASRYSMKTRLFLWGRDSRNANGNLLLDKLIDAEFQFLSKEEYENVSSIMSRQKEEFARKGKRVYIIPEGGSSPWGIWGYVDFVRELVEKNKMNKVKGILTAAGTGGTAAGILIGNAVYNTNFKVFAVNVLYDEKTIKEKIFSLVEDFAETFNFKKKVNLGNLEIMDGYSREGYKNIDDEKIGLIKEFFQSTGILLDPAYTGKAFTAFSENFLHRKVSDVMFLHSGGIFGVFGKSKRFLEV